MMKNFSESGHLIFCASSALQRGELKSKGGGKKSINFNGSDENIWLLLRAVISANQVSVYGIVPDLCNELSECFRCLVKPETPDFSSFPETQTSAQQQRNLAQEYERKIEQSSDDQKLSKLCSEAGLNLVEKREILLCSSVSKGTCEPIFMPRIHITSR